MMKSTVVILLFAYLAAVAYGHDSGERHRRYPLCPSNPCLNGGICETLNSTTTRCVCSPGFTGAICENLFDWCNPNPCQNGAACKNIGYEGYRCDCTPCNSDYTGRNCEVRNYCRNTPCLNGGECRNTNVSYTCKCPRGFTGANCESQLDYCASYPCQNGGTCAKVGFVDFKCTCLATHTGRICDLVNYCNGVVCQTGGTCLNRASTYRCTYTSSSACNSACSRCRQDRGVYFCL